MKNNLWVIILILFIFYSCNSETAEPKPEKGIIQEDSVQVEKEDTVVSQELPSEKLPRMAGSWIETNLDNEYFRSKKVDSLVASKPAGPIMPTDEAVAFFNYDFLSQREIQKLTVKELLYYNLAYPCSYSQVCAAGIEDTTTFPKIGGYLPFSWDGEQMSMRQSTEIKMRRDSVMIVLMDYIQKYPDKLSIKYFEILLELDAAEAIPIIIKTASEKNLDNYSFLLDLMHKNEYERLRELDFYDLLYGEESYRYENRAPASKENREAVTKLAYAYYVSIFG